jgi:hypothetical protein
MKSTEKGVDSFHFLFFFRAFALVLILFEKRYEKGDEETNFTGDWRLYGRREDNLGPWATAGCACAG